MAATYFQDQAESGRKRISLTVSVVFHIAILLLAYFFVRWEPQDPPVYSAEYGTMVNFGVDAEGFGEQQSYAPANDNALADAKPGDVPTQETPEEQSEQEVQQEEEISSASTQDEPSPIEVPPAPTKKPEPVRQEPKPTPAPKPEPKPALPPAPSYKPSTGQPGGGGVAGTSDGVAGNNNGDRPGKTGDQGKPNGTLDAKGLYGNGGNGTGSNLELAGWNWDSKPSKVDPFDEEGKIVFEIKVDDEGNIASVRPIEKTVSPKVVQFYQSQVENLTFSKTRDNASPAPISVGKITIIIRSR